MNAIEPKSEWIRLVASPTDRALLTAITLHAGDDNMSATIRRLIRQEARRQGITPADARSLSSAHVCTSS
jgi:hypothetical protein